MLIVPLGLENPPRDRALFAVIVASLLVYQSILIVLFPALKPNALWLMKASLGDYSLYRELVLGFFRSPSAIHSFLFFLFWGVIGPGLEDKSGKGLLIATFLAGCLVPFLAGRLELLAWERGYWPGLGGAMACLGLGYYFLWEAEVRFFYFLPTPFVMPLGFSSMAALFVLLFFHLVVAVSQIHFYSVREAHLRPPGVATALWLLVLPLLVLVGCLFATKVIAFVRRARGEQAAETH